MRNDMRRFLGNRASVAAVVLLLAGCATSPVATSAASHVPNDRIFNHAYLLPRPDTAEILVKRDSGISGAVASIRILLDGQRIANLFTSEKITLHVPPGYHVLSADFDWKVGDVNIPEVAADVRAGDRRAFRVGVDGSGNLTLSPTAF